MAQILMIAARNYRDFPESAFESLLEPEAEALRVAYAAGIARQAWTRKDKPGAIVLLECESVEAAKAWADTLPLRAAGMLDAEFVELAGYRGFFPRG